MITTGAGAGHAAGIPPPQQPKGEGGEQVRHGADERSPVSRKDSNRWRELTVAGVGPNPPGNIAEEFTKPVKHEILIKGSE